MNLMIYLYSILIGALAGLLSGLFGIGGGIVIVPLLSYLLTILHFPVETAINFAAGTSLATMVFSTLSASFFQHRKKAVLWHLFWYIAPGTMLGGLIGSGLGDLLPKEILKGTFSVFCLVVAVLFFRKEITPKDPEAGLPIYKTSLLLIGLLVGILASMVGVGGGVLLVPLLVRLHLSFPHAIALSVSCTLPTVTAGMVGAIIFGWDHPPVPLPTLGYVIWPLALIQGSISLLTARLGVHLAYQLPLFWLRKLLAVLLLLIAWLMLFL